MTAARDALVAALVKPMEWKQYVTDKGTHGTAATTVCGRYLCVPSGWFLVGQSGWMPEPTLAAAQAAAEADYRARIAAALDLDKLAALVEAAKPYVSPVQNADYGRQLRQHDALVSALAALGEKP